MGVTTLKSLRNDALAKLKHHNINLQKNYSFILEFTFKKFKNSYVFILYHFLKIK